jgi:hypothetical protein
MSSSVPKRRGTAAGKIAGALLMLALLAFLTAAAAFPGLHEACCPEAGQPTDTCALVASPRACSNRLLPSSLDSFCC